MTHDGAPLRAVLFDWAGTTVDHGSRAPVMAVRELFRLRGIAITDAEARGPMGRAKRDHIAAVLALPRVALAWHAARGQAPCRADVDLLYDEFLPLQKDVLAHHGDVIAGVPEAVAELQRRGIKIGATTGYTRSLMEVVTPLARAGGYDPDVIICADDVPEGRPAPWMIFRAAERLNVFPMTSVVVVDDTAVGIAAGLNAGAWTVAVTRTGNSLGLSRDELAQVEPSELTARLAAAADDFRSIGAHHVVESVADLLPVIDHVVAQLPRTR